MSWATAVGVGLSLMGANKEARGHEKTGRRAKEKGREQKVFNYSTAQQVMASGQAAYLEEIRQSELMASRAVAVAAAGGSVSDVDNLIADIHGEGVYRASLALRDYEMEAESLRFSGDQAAEYGADQEESYRGKAKATRYNAFAGLFGSGVFD